MEDHRQLFCLIIIPQPFLLLFAECYVNVHSIDVNLDASFFMFYNKNMISYVILKGAVLRSVSLCDEDVRMELLNDSRSMHGMYARI